MRTTYWVTLYSGSGLEEVEVLAVPVAFAHPLDQRPHQAPHEGRSELLLLLLLLVVTQMMLLVWPRARGQAVLLLRGHWVVSRERVLRGGDAMTTRSGGACSEW